jgi:hypothetical protein
MIIRPLDFGVFSPSDVARERCSGAVNGAGNETTKSEFISGYIWDHENFFTGELGSLGRRPGSDH